MGLGDRVAFVGHIAEAARFLAEVDIVAVCSRLGRGLSAATIEAMAAGRPVIVTAVGGASEAVEEGVTGYIVAPGDVEALRNRIVLLVQDAALRKCIGDAARRRTETLFSIAGNVQRTECLYGETLGGVSRGEIVSNLCGETRFRVVEEDEAPFRVLRCLRCSLVFPWIRSRDLQALGEHYDGEIKGSGNG